MDGFTFFMFCLAVVIIRWISVYERNCMYERIWELHFTGEISDRDAIYIVDVPKEEYFRKYREWVVNNKVNQT